MNILKFFFKKRFRKIKIAEGYLKGLKNWYVLKYDAEKNIIYVEADELFGSRRSKNNKKLPIDKSILLITSKAKKLGYQKLLKDFLKKHYKDESPYIKY